MRENFEILPTINVFYLDKVKIQHACNIRDFREDSTDIFT